MAQNLYKDYLKLLKSWPVDKNKGNKDLGLHLREQIKVAFSKGGIQTQSEIRKCQVNLQSLNRIATNYYSKAYGHRYDRLASGLTLKDCQTIVSPEAIEVLNKQKGFFRRLLNTIIRPFIKKEQ